MLYAEFWFTLKGSLVRHQFEDECSPLPDEAVHVVTEPIQQWLFELQRL